MPPTNPTRPARTPSAFRAAAFALPLALALLAGAASPAPACEVRPVAEVPIDASTPNMIVKVSVDGTPLPFILDTGAQRTVLDAATVQRLGVKRDEWAATTMRGVGGEDQQRNAKPASVVLGGIMLRPRSVAPFLSLPVATLPYGLIGGVPIGGLLGSDLLSNFDLAIDGPKRRLTLNEVHDCSGGFLPWKMPYEALPTMRPIENVLLIPVQVDGHVLMAELDSGAAYTTVLAPGMAKLGLTMAQIARDRPLQARGLGPNAVTMHFHRFASMSVGSRTQANPTLLVGPARALRIVDMLLGADWLRPRLVWVSYATSKVFVAEP
ncbi:MAG: aspartyl protease family protein [Proteobacteria bacterium]|nr:aspartyl protease family protein [Pseudomonadota bacterium]